MDTSGQAVGKREPQRRRRSIEEKRGIVKETLEPGASVAKVARVHGVNANQVLAWRRQYRQGLLGKENGETVNLLPVHVTGTRASKAHRSSRQVTHRTTDATGTIHVELPKGQLRIAGRVDVEALHVVLEKLLG